MLVTSLLSVCAALVALCPCVAAQTGPTAALPNASSPPTVALPPLPVHSLRQAAVLMDSQSIAWIVACSVVFGSLALALCICCIIIYCRRNQQTSDALVAIPLDQMSETTRQRFLHTQAHRQPYYDEAQPQPPRQLYATLRVPETGEVRTILLPHQEGLTVSPTPTRQITVPVTLHTVEYVTARPMQAHLTHSLTQGVTWTYTTDGNAPQHMAPQRTHSPVPSQTSSQNPLYGEPVEYMRAPASESKDNTAASHETH